MELDIIVGLVVDICEYCIPFSLIFGFSAKAINFAFDMIFDRKISL